MVRASCVGVYINQKMKKITIYIIWSFWLLLSINGFSQLNSEPQKSNLKKDELTPLQILTDSTIQYPFGYFCSKSGTPPEGRQAINKLLEARDIKTIRAVLDGHNKTGKIYAIELLLILASHKYYVLTEGDKEKIKAIINQDYLIERCEGDYYSSIHVIDLFNEKVYKKLLTKSQIEIKDRK